MAGRLPIGVLVSGSGSNLQSLIDHIENGKLDAEIKVVLCNNSKAYALERCVKHRITSRLIDHRNFPSRELFDRCAVEILNAAGVKLVVMAGFMRILSSSFLQAFHNRIINIHPALLPSFPGTHVQQKAIDYGAKFSGCTVHFIDEGVDTGPIIIQAVVPVLDDDTAETLAARILTEEHRIYPQAVQYFAENRIDISGRRVRIRGARSEAYPGLYNPSLSINKDSINTG